jgi:hypothetical protein
VLGDTRLYPLRKARDHYRLKKQKNRVECELLRDAGEVAAAHEEARVHGPVASERPQLVPEGVAHGHVALLEVRTESPHAHRCSPRASAARRETSGTGGSSLSLLQVWSPK